MTELSDQEKYRRSKSLHAIVRDYPFIYAMATMQNLIFGHDDARVIRDIDAIIAFCDRKLNSCWDVEETGDYVTILVRSRHPNHEAGIFMERVINVRATELMVPHEEETWGRAIWCSIPLDNPDPLLGKWTLVSACRFSRERDYSEITVFDLKDLGAFDQLVRREYSDDEAIERRRLRRVVSE